MHRVQQGPTHSLPGKELKSRVSARNGISSVLQCGKLQMSSLPERLELTLWKFLTGKYILTNIVSITTISTSETEVSVPEENLLLEAVLPYFLYEILIRPDSTTVRCPEHAQKEVHHKSKNILFLNKYQSLCFRTDWQIPWPRGFYSIQAKTMPSGSRVTDKLTD